MPALKNQRHEKFVQLILSGMSHGDAYRATYPDARSKKSGNNAWRLMRREDVQARYRELRDEMDARLTAWAIMTRGEKRLMLKQIAEDENSSAAERMKAIDLDNKMAGEYARSAESAGLAAEQSKLDALLAELRRRPDE